MITIFGGAAPATTFLSATKLTVTIPAAAIASTGTLAVTVTNPAPGGTVLSCDGCRFGPGARCLTCSVLYLVSPEDQAGILADAEAVIMAGNFRVRPVSTD